MVKNTKDLFCDFCGKEYKFNSGLSRHNKNCKKREALENKLEILSELVKTAR